CQRMYAIAPTGAGCPTMLAMSTLVIPVDQKDASTNLTFEPRTPPTRSENAMNEPLKPLDITELRKSARQRMEEGAVTAGYSANREDVIVLLNDALATELVCVLRYRRHHFMASGIHSH